MCVCVCVCVCVCLSLSLSLSEFVLLLSQEEDPRDGGPALRDLRDELQSVAVDANHRGSTLFVILFVFKLIVSEVQTSLRSAVHETRSLKVEEIEG